MPTSLRERIESDIAQLAMADQLWLMERLAQRIRRQTLPPPAVLESDLAAMAADPAMQHEIQQIADEFAPTEPDGLDNI
jgi:hypothetical protein